MNTRHDVMSLRRRDNIRHLAGIIMRFLRVVQPRYRSLGLRHGLALVHELLVDGAEVIDCPHMLCLFCGQSSRRSFRRPRRSLANAYFDRHSKIKKRLLNLDEIAIIDKNGKIHHFKIHFRISYRIDGIRHSNAI